MQYTCKRRCTKHRLRKTREWGTYSGPANARHHPSLFRDSLAEIYRPKRFSPVPGILMEKSLKKMIVLNFNHIFLEMYKWRLYSWIHDISLVVEQVVHVHAAIWLAKLLYRNHLVQVLHAIGATEWRHGIVCMTVVNVCVVFFIP